LIVYYNIGLYIACLPVMKYVMLSRITKEITDCGASFITDGPAPFQNASGPCFKRKVRTNDGMQE